MTRTRATGWQVTLTHPDTGRKTEPDLADDPEFRANPRGLPEARVPVAQTAEWARDWDGSDMRLTEDGVPAPIDQLDRVEVEQGQTILVGVGGVELREVVATDIQIEETHLAAERLIQENTTYTANVDAPVVEVLKDELVQSPETGADFSVLTENLGDVPLTINDTDATVDQVATCIPRQGEGYNTGTEGFEDVVDPNEYADGDWWVGSRGPAAAGPDSATWQITPERDIPADQVRVAVRAADNGHAGAPGFEWQLAGVTIEENTFVGVDGVGEPRWLEIASQSVYEGPGEYSGPTLEAGQTYDLSVEITDSDGDADTYQYHVDHVAVYDARYNHGNAGSDNTFDESISSGGPLANPTPYAESIPFAFVDYEDPFLVTGGAADVTTVQYMPSSIALSNDRGATYPISATDTTSVSGTFPDTGATLRLQVEFGRQGTGGTTSPSEGFDPLRLDAYDLFADLDRTPTLIDYSEERRLADILADIAGEEFLWEVARDANGTTSVEWAEPEQRVADDTPQLTDLTVQKDSERITEVTVKGANARISETFAGSTSYVDLDRSDIVPQTETVTPTNGDRTFLRGDDYEMKFRSGEIRILDDSDMTAGETYAIDYQSEIRNTVTATPNDGNAEVVSVPAAATERAAGQLAQFLVDEFSVPRWRATARIPPQTGVFSAIDAINVGLADELPDGAFPLSPRNVEDTPEGLVVQLGRTRDFASAVSELSGQLQSVSKRV